MKFLVVDDDPAILKIVSRFIELSENEVDTCDNALEAIQNLADLSYDILITDATMPAYSGFDLIRSVKKNPQLDYLTVSMLTGRSDKSDIERAVKLGVQDYIVKPIEPEILLKKIQRLCEIHKKKKKQKPKPLSTNAFMEVPICVTRVTDLGLRVQSPYPIKKGTLVNINLDVLKEAGISKTQFKSMFHSSFFFQV